VDLAGPRAMVAAIQAARKEIEAGHTVCIFAEGSVTRTGNLLPFKRGMEKIVDGLAIPVIPVHLDRVWGSIFSFAGGQFFGKTPRQWPFRAVTFDRLADRPGVRLEAADARRVGQLGHLQAGLHARKLPPTFESAPATAPAASSASISPVP